MPHDFTAISTDEEPRIGHYELLSTIGMGSFAKVKLARHILTGTEVAVKAIQRQGCKRPLGEVRCMKVLNHPNVVKLFEVADTESTLFLVMEHVSGGGLGDYLKDRGRVTAEEDRGLFRQLVSAVQYCHQKGIAHRDLKPENVLLDAEQNVKLADFGLSKDFSRHKLRAFCGSLPHIAPELYLGRVCDGPRVDVWSLGVLLYEMVTGTLPFIAKDYWMLRLRVLSGRYPAPSFRSLDCKNLFKRCMAVSASERETLEEFMKDPWLHLGQEEELRPYVEPPWDTKDAWVTEVMTNLGFNRDQVQESMARRKYDKLMATYLMLSTKKPEGKVRTIKVRPFPRRT